jgi:pyruvate/2-oxoglutarate/acetoin dehydrogenase E1 component
LSFEMATYRDELARAMTLIGQLDEAVFVGQAVAVPGTAMFGTLRDVPMAKRIEMPVEEDLQMGMSTGLALTGYLPISIFPRWNFLLLAMNQLVNHLDKMSELTGGHAPKVIIRTGIGSERPLHPGPQHTGDYSEALALMAPNLHVQRLDEPDEIVPAYLRAVQRDDGVSSLLVEWGDFYNEK